MDVFISVCEKNEVNVENLLNNKLNKTNFDVLIFDKLMGIYEKQQNTKDAVIVFSRIFSTIEIKFYSKSINEIISVCNNKNVTVRNFLLKHLYQAGLISKSYNREWNGKKYCINFNFKASQPANHVSSNMLFMVGMHDIFNIREVIVKCMRDQNWDPIDSRNSFNNLSHNILTGK